MQVRTRLTVQFSLIVAGLLLCAFAYIFYQVSAYFIHKQYTVLKSKAYMIASSATAQIESDLMVNWQRRSSFGPSFYTENIGIYDSQGHLVFSFAESQGPPQPDLLRAVLIESREHTFVKGRFLSLLMPHVSQSGQKYVVYAEALMDVSDRNQLLRTLLLLMGLMLASVALAGWLFAGRALQPANKMISDINAIAAGDLTRRLPQSSAVDEFATLSRAFNQLLERIQKVFEAQKSFLAHISHEIKNPFTKMSAQIEVGLQRERSPKEYQQMLRSLLEEVREVNKVSDNLMQLARVQSGNVAERFEKVRLDELILTAKGLMEKACPEYTIRFRLEEPPDDESNLVLWANEQLMRAAVTNLMENSCKFSADKTVDVSLRWNANLQPILEFEDRGPGIDLEDGDMIFDPFYRGQFTHDFKGTGIGLSLVKSICGLHGITLSFENRPGGGARFWMLFENLR